ncbi:Major cold shock protein CspA [compost metagenome]
MPGPNPESVSVTKVNSLSILKTVHLLSGAAALLLSFVPSLRAESLPWLQQPDALYLAFIGLGNLLLAPLVAGSRQPLQALASALLILAVALQSLSLLVPLERLAGQPTVLFSLLATAAAVLVQLLPAQRDAAAVAVAKEPREARPAPTKPAPSAAAGQAPSGEREAGTVKWFNTSKGFGFISRDRGEDIFVHFRAIRGEGHRVLVEGQRVEFSVVQRDKGLQAEDVMIID